MEWSEIKSFALYLLIIAVMIFTFGWGGPYLLKHSIGYWSGNDYNVLLVGDFHPKSPTDATPVRTGFYTALRSRKNSSPKFTTDVVPIDESVVDQINGPTETDTKMLNDEIESELVDHIAKENVVAVVTASSSQTVGACLKTGKMFNIPVLITHATESDCLSGYDTTGIGYRLVANNHNQVPIITEWVDSMVSMEKRAVMHLDSLTVETARFKMLRSYKNDWLNGLLAAPGTGPEMDSVSLKNELDTLMRAGDDTSDRCKMVGILYMPTKYGNDLSNELKDTLRKAGYSVITFPISNTNSIVYSMHQTEEKLSITNWIAICYGDEAQNIVSLEERQNTAGTSNKAKKPCAHRILFCEAAYGHWMAYHSADADFYALHTDNLKRSVNNTYYSEVAEDAYYILEYCLTDIQTTAKSDLITHLTAFPTSTKGGNWHGHYAFWNRQGENMMARPVYCSFSKLVFPGDTIK